MDVLVEWVGVDGGMTPASVCSNIKHLQILVRLLGGIHMYTVMMGTLNMVHDFLCNKDVHVDTTHVDYSSAYLRLSILPLFLG